MKTFLISMLGIAIFSALAVGYSKEKASKMIEKESFGKLPDGQEAFLYTLRNKDGTKVSITNFGATIVSIDVPDKNGKFADVTFGYDNVKGYAEGNQFFGATIGRYANRIARGTFNLEGKSYHLPINNGVNSLHGGPAGFYKRLWTAETMETKEGPQVRMSYTSKDGEEGYPGELKTTITFTLMRDNSLRINYAAETDKPTVLNLTNHSYFNLSGNPTRSILDEELKINAASYTPVDSTQIPTGQIAEVAGTPMDFRRLTAIGARINERNEQLEIGHGYDLNWILDGDAGKIREAAELYDASSGRVLEVFTDQPGIQFYSGNFLNGSDIGKKGVAYQYRTALCLETQHYPDSPNKPQFPSTVLKPGERFNSTTIFKFSVRK